MLLKKDIGLELLEAGNVNNNDTAYHVEHSETPHQVINFLLQVAMDACIRDPERI